MNNSNREAGQSTYDMAARRRKSRTWFVLIIAAIVLLAALLIFRSQALGIGGMGIIALAVLARFVMSYGDVHERKMRKEERRALRGAKAEEKIGGLLGSLGDGFLVIHDITSPYGNIDHVVISEKAGIFLLETKSHGGRVSNAGSKLLVNGHDPEKDFIAQTLKNTYWLRDEIQRLIGIQPWIKPILVFTNAFVEQMPPIKGVTIVNKKFLASVLQRPNASGENMSIWSNREQIQRGL